MDLNIAVSRHRSGRRHHHHQMAMANVVDRLLSMTTNAIITTVINISIVIATTAAIEKVATTNVMISLIGMILVSPLVEVYH